MSQRKHVTCMHILYCTSTEEGEDLWPFSSRTEMQSLHYFQTSNNLAKAQEDVAMIVYYI